MALTVRYFLAYCSESNFLLADKLLVRFSDLNFENVEECSFVLDVGGPLYKGSTLSNPLLKFADSSTYTSTNIESSYPKSGISR